MALSKKRWQKGLNQEFLNSLQNEESRFLKELQEQYKSTGKTLWQWQMNVPLSERWNKFINTNEDFAKFIKTPNLYKKEKLRSLDLGCGFGMYWPILREFGFTKFVGIDLFDNRILIQHGGLTRMERFINAIFEIRPRKALRSLLKNPIGEDYLNAAHKFIQEFCPDIDYQLIQGDVRNIDQFQLKFNSFDLIYAYAVDYTKTGSTGIPRQIFDKIVEKYGAENCMTVYHV